MEKTLDTPYISINKLAEYMTASPTRRRQILTSLKGDNDFMKVYYSEVKNIILPYFKDLYDSNIIDKAIKKIEKKKGTTSWDDKDNPNSILALQHLKNTELPDLTDYDIVNIKEKISHIDLGGVLVTIKPELYLQNRYSNKMGAVKIHIAKTEKNRLTLIGMQYVATMIKVGYLNYGYTESEIDNNGCFSIDIFEENFGSAPKAYKRHLEALTAACEEIAARWSTL